VTLADEKVIETLNRDFVCGVWDITGAPYAGKSNAHSVHNPAVQTTCGAGPRNVQLAIANADGRVLMALPGYWHPTDLLREIEFAKSLDRVWADKSLSLAQKEAKFVEMQLAQAASVPADTLARSRMQGFDVKYSAEHRIADVFAGPLPALENGKMAGKAAAKPVAQLMHERMASYPFVRLEEFDIDSFTNYGKPHYDKKDDEGIPFPNEGKRKQIRRPQERRGIPQIRPKPGAGWQRLGG